MTASRSKEQKRAMAEGYAQEEAARKVGARGRPSRYQLLLPLLEEIQDLGGRAKPGEIYDRLAARLAVPANVAHEEKTFADGQPRNLWKREVRWARQVAVARKLVAAPERGVWELTALGSDSLHKIRPGLVLTVFETEGGLALWSNAEDAAGVIERESLNLIFVSPPYPILTGRAYGGFDPAAWLEWMRHLGGLWRDLLTPDGSLMVNLGATYLRGMAVQSGYIERFTLMMLDELKFHLAQRLYWYSPNKLPSPIPWVAVRRVRVKNSVEPILWFSKGAACKANNRNVLVEYKQDTVDRYIGREGKVLDRASGYKFGPTSWSADNGGAIPSNVIVASSGGGRGHYHRRCREEGLPIHPAPFPEALPTFGIKLTTDVGDIVYDPMSGSGTTAVAAARLGRRWVTSERALAYVQGHSFQFERDSTFKAYPVG